MSTLVKLPYDVAVLEYSQDDNKWTDTDQLRQGGRTICQGPPDDDGGDETGVLLLQYNFEDLPKDATILAVSYKLPVRCKWHDEDNEGDDDVNIECRWGGQKGGGPAAVSFDFSGSPTESPDDYTDFHGASAHLPDVDMLRRGVVTLHVETPEYFSKVELQALEITVDYTTN